MRNGVVDVEQVEAMREHDLVHAHGEGKVVGRILEQRVLADIDLVEEDAGEEGREAKRLLVGDEVHLVSALGEGDPELGTAPEPP
jgi:hypothetical protein